MNKNCGNCGNAGPACSSCDSWMNQWKPAKPTATRFLEVSREILEERGKTYDSQAGERSMGKTIAAFNTITGRDLTEPEGWLLLQILKDVRQWSRDGYHQDSAEDCVTYAALKAEALAKEEGGG